MQEGKTLSYTHRLPVPRTRRVPAVRDTPSTPPAALCLPDGENRTLIHAGWRLISGEGTCWELAALSWGTCFRLEAWRITARVWWPLNFTYLLAWQSRYCTCNPHFQPFESPCGTYSNSGGDQPKQQAVLRWDKPQLVFMWSFIVLKNSPSRPDNQCGKRCI